jgi:hypothetical protein
VGGPVNPGAVAGSINVLASAFDPPPIKPPAPWNVARLAPDSVWFDLANSAGTVVSTSMVAYFGFTIPPNSLYSWIYAPGTYQNKPHRPGQYIFWIAHGLDTTAFPDGTYTLEVYAADTRDNFGEASVPLTIANGALTQAVSDLRFRSLERDGVADNQTGRHGAGSQDEIADHHLQDR